MSTKRTRRARHRVEEGLPKAVADLLLNGWEAIDAHDPVKRADPEYDWTAPFTWSAATLERAWREHRSWLLEEWERRGGVGAPWAATQYDEKEN